MLLACRIIVMLKMLKNLKICIKITVKYEILFFIIFPVVSNQLFSFLKRILDLVIGLKLSCIDEVWQKFWRCPNVDYSEYENLLPKDRFVALCSIPPVIEFVKACDYQFYQFCVDTLIPDVLRAIPGNFSQQIRNFAKSLENWLRNALLNIPEEMQQIKVVHSPPPFLKIN